MNRILLFTLLILLPQLGAEEYDVCIYGATSGGVVAAMQADRMGKSVILLEPYQNVGGMASNGLSALDVGNPATIGGIAREYFSELAGRYGKELKFENYFAHTGGDFVIEPSGAQAETQANAARRIRKPNDGLDPTLTATRRGPVTLP